MYKLLIAFFISMLSLPAMARTDFSYFTAYGGLFDMQRDTKKGMGGLELRFNQFNDIFVPKLGGFVAGEGATYFYGGFNLELPIYDDCLFLIPGFAVGGYSKNSGKNLGGPLEFHSSIELNYRFLNCHRVGIAFGHISNASIYKKNPGEEDLLFTYSVPFSF